MLRALIIDDEPYCCEILAAILEADCPDVKVENICNNGADALNAIKQYLPDIVFLDVEMPKMNGYDSAMAIVVHDQDFFQWPQCFEG